MVRQFNFVDNALLGRYACDRLENRCPSGMVPYFDLWVKISGMFVSADDHSRWIKIPSR